VLQLQAQKDTLIKKRLYVEEVVISGKMREMKKIDSPIPIESYQSTFFRKAAVNNLLDATQQITGLRPQINCSVCNTGDIHMNGMEGAYTAILIDGMPVVSSLASIYGLSGIPLSMIDRVEVIKGPSSAIYGSQAMAGVINIITKKTTSGDLVSYESSLTSMQEFSNDLAFRWKLGTHIKSLSSISLYNFNKPYDVNKDGFSDLALQNRISLFNKITIGKNEEYQMALRYFKEDRWGGQLNWSEQWRGTDSVYGEAINTNRVEVLQNFKINRFIPMDVQSSYVYHQQNSTYGTTQFNANQHLFFVQGVHQYKIKKQEYEIGSSFNFQHYDDNTVLTRNTVDTSKTIPLKIVSPGVFVQQQISWSKSWKSLLAWRTDFQQAHGFIHSPRLSIQYKRNEQTQYRLGLGRGFRVVNVFTEDHAALSGDRKIKIAESLNPESSINSFFSIDHLSLLVNATLKTEVHFFYSYFFNRIQANYDEDPNSIIYRNLNGSVESRGVNIRFDLQSEKSWNSQLGITFLDAFERRKNGSPEKLVLMFSSLLNINYNFSYQLNRLNTKIDYQVVGYSPMRLPVLPNDYRSEYSPWYALHQVQVTNTTLKRLDVYVALKNIFNFLPSDPLMRPFDPFDKRIHQNNPYQYTFDTTYGYAPMQGRRVLIGLRYHVSRSRARKA
jgi:outer membrane receptor for ferrienterochelin and colicins